MSSFDIFFFEICENKRKIFKDGFLLSLFFRYFFFSVLVLFCHFMIHEFDMCVEVSFVVVVVNELFDARCLHIFGV